MEEAKEIINKLITSSKEPQLEFGGVYQAKIVEIRDIGLMVTLYDGMRPALLHISQIDQRKVGVQFIGPVVWTWLTVQLIYKSVHSTAKQYHKPLYFFSSWYNLCYLNQNGFPQSYLILDSTTGLLHQLLVFLPINSLIFILILRLVTPVLWDSKSTRRFKSSILGWTQSLDKCGCPERSSKDPLLWLTTFRRPETIWYCFRESIFMIVCT